MSNHWIMTHHAQKRSQQRQIDGDAVAAVIWHGDAYYAGNGTRAFYMSRNAMRRAQSKYCVSLAEYERAAVILSPNGAVITVQHVDRPKRSWRGRH